MIEQQREKVDSFEQEIQEISVRVRTKRSRIFGESMEL